VALYSVTFWIRQAQVSRLLIGIATFRCNANFAAVAEGGPLGRRGRQPGVAPSTPLSSRHLASPSPPARSTSCPLPQHSFAIMAEGSNYDYLFKASMLHCLRAKQAELTPAAIGRTHRRLRRRQVVRALQPTFVSFLTVLWDRNSNRASASAHGGMYRLKLVRSAFAVHAQRVQPRVQVDHWRRVCDSLYQCRRQDYQGADLGHWCVLPAASPGRVCLTCPRAAGQERYRAITAAYAPHTSRLPGHAQAMAS
jgi:hypothetical protein